jgi:hypothetical protein
MAGTDNSEARSKIHPNDTTDFVIDIALTFLVRLSPDASAILLQQYPLTCCLDAGGSDAEKLRGTNRKLSSAEPCGSELLRLVFCATMHCNHTRYRVPRKWSTAGPSAIQPSLAARLDMQCRTSQEQPSDQTHGNARFEPCTR